MEGTCDAFMEQTTSQDQVSAGATYLSLMAGSSLVAFACASMLPLLYLMIEKQAAIVVILCGADPYLENNLRMRVVDASAGARTLTVRDMVLGGVRPSFHVFMAVVSSWMMLLAADVFRIAPQWASWVYVNDSGLISVIPFAVAVSTMLWLMMAMLLLSGVVRVPPRESPSSYVQAALTLESVISPSY